MPSIKMKALKCKTLGACVAWQGQIAHDDSEKQLCTLYIGMDEVFQHHAHTFEKSDLNFQFQFSFLFIPSLYLFLIQRIFHFLVYSIANS